MAFMTWRGNAQDRKEWAKLLRSLTKEEVLELTGKERTLLNNILCREAN